jgi:hypothetical protein
MYNSILQLATGLAERILKRAENGEIKDIDAMAAEVSDDCRRTSAEMIQEIVRYMNEKVREDKSSRKWMGLVIKEKDRPRQLFTELGMLDLKRDYYYDKKNDRYTAVLDHILGIEKYERIGGTVGADLITKATDVSYGKAADLVTGGAISRQEVHDLLVRMEVPEYHAKHDRRTVEELHIYADEDHVSMQRPNKRRGKKSKIVPLVTVTEGTVKESERRNRTIEPMHFVDEKFDTKELWKSVEGYIDRRYDIENIRKIYVHGDGGQWIRNGLEELAQTEHVMDGYHFFKALRGISNILPKRNVKIVMLSALERDDHVRADSFIRDLLQEPLTDKEKKTICDFAGYLFRNWDEIRGRIVEEVPGSCTEAQISHVLSERFSRDPLGWSEVCLGKLTSARVYVKNGGTITKDVFKREEEKYTEYADRFIEENMKGTFDYSIFENEIPIFDTDSGTQHAIRNLLQ